MYFIPYFVAVHKYVGINNPHVYIILKFCRNTRLWEDRQYGDAQVMAVLGGH